MALTMCHKIIFQRSKHAHKRTELPAGINVQINKNSLMEYNSSLNMYEQKEDHCGRENTTIISCQKFFKV